MAVKSGSFELSNGKIQEILDKMKVVQEQSGLTFDEFIIFLNHFSSKRMEELGIRINKTIETEQSEENADIPDIQRYSDSEVH